MLICPGFPPVFPIDAFEIIMQQLKSLFCFQGVDQPLRFGLVHLATLLLFLLFTQFPAQLFAMQLLLTLPLLVLGAASARRRVRDTGRPAWLTAIPVSGALLSFGFITFTSHGSALLLLMLPVLTTLALMAEKGQKPHRYVTGYAGPVDLSASYHPQANQSARIEPTLTGEHGHQPTQAEIAVEEPPLQTSEPSEWLNQAKAWIESNRKAAFAGLGVLFVAITVAAILPLMSAAPTVQPEAVVEQQPEPQSPAVAKERRNPLPINDYELLMDEYNALVIHWTSDENDDPTWWSILTADGESSCQAAVFNDNTRYRTNLVAVEDSGEVFASFSPLDTESIVRAIANKSRFSLCGYDFSLKGSRATISESRHYANYLIL